MEPEKSTTTPQPEEQHALAHTYQDDMAKAMDITDPATIQAMLADAREREGETVVIAAEQRERKWYSLSSLLLLLMTVAIAGYGAYYYMHLTVKTQPTASVGVFQSTDNIAIDTTTIQEVLTTLAKSTTLPVGKPLVVNLVKDSKTNTLISNSDLYSFIGAQLTEPLQASIAVARLGVVNTGKEVLPFIIASVPDPLKTSKELTIAEPTLLQLFSQALTIPAAVVPSTTTVTTQSPTTASAQVATMQVRAIQAPVVLPTFKSQYFYNLPVRSLSAINPVTGQQDIVFLYGYVSNTILVITTKPTVLKAVYDTILSQH